MAKKTVKSAEELAAEASKLEMQAKRDEITAYYKDSIKHLKVQQEYEALLKDIETSRAERIQAQTFIANAMAQQQAAQQAPAPTADAGSGNAVAGTDWEASSDKAPPAVDPAFADAARKLKTT
tara:strand:+ start:263 stop:631 length:369 start_codon:yes stop_codon:yes gene_type:complete